MLTFLPALVILLSRALVEVVAAGSERLRRPHWRWALTAAALLPLLLINTGFFVSARPASRDFESRRGDSWLWRARDELHDWIMSRTAAALREHEAVIRTYVETIRAVYDPVDTALLTELGNPRSYPWLRHAMFYLPEYPIYQIQTGSRSARLPRSPVGGDHDPDPGLRHHRAAAGEAARLVRGPLGPAIPRPQGLHEILLPYGRFLYVLPLGIGDVEHAGYSFVRDEW